MRRQPFHTIEEARERLSPFTIGKRVRVGRALCTEDPWYQDKVFVVTGVRWEHRRDRSDSYMADICIVEEDLSDGGTDGFHPDDLVVVV